MTRAARTDAAAVAAADALAAFDLLATLVAVVSADGRVLHANASFENLLGVPRRAMLGTTLCDWLADSAAMKETLAAVSANRIATGRFEAVLKRPQGAAPELLPVHVIVNQTDHSERVLVEMIEIEQQTRQEREERAATQAEANKELVRNLAHEIKNPLGGIRGAAQLLEMELEARRDLTEYTQVVIAEADRLQALVDRLLAPHRHAHVVADVNIHEVCERVRALLAAEFPRGIAIKRDYDISIPEFRGDREQLIQALLNIARNACQAMAERIAAGDARLALRTRIARQVTIGKQRWRLALELHIEDNGPGVPESIRDRIFYPLVTGRDGGSGLGLTLAQTFVQQHQGTIECDSVPGHTVFTVLLPLP
jgi:two-component system, NtrC family, nitrogen regulation sensor histidine kinase GlnL